MADIGRSSFIPKESGGMTPGKMRRRRTFHVFGFISTTMLVGSLVLAGGVYFLKSTADSGLEDAQTALRDQKNLFKPENIAEVREFDRRLQAAELLLKNHVAPLKIFTALEEETKQKIQFTEFELEHTPELEMILTLTGSTPEFKTLALQELQFGDDQVLRNILFNEVASDDDEGEGSGDRSITFSLKGTIDPALVRYDGTPARTTQQVSFTEDTSALTVEGEGARAVLGESVSLNGI